MSVRTNRRTAADAGMTVLELLVVLAIGAVIVTVAAVSVPRWDDSRRPSEDVAALITDAKLQAAATGRPVVVEIAPGTASDGSRSVSWNSGVSVVLSNGGAQGRIVFHGDGTMVGPQVRIVLDGQTVSFGSPDRLPSPAS